MFFTGPVVELEVAKQGAIYHGLAELLAKPSPLLSPRNRPGSQMGSQMDQHLYQNHRPGPPPQMMQSPIQRPPQQNRSASIQNLNQPIQHPGPQRQISQPVLNGRPLMNGDDQGYYQNIGTNLQQPMPLRYNNGPGPLNGQKFGSQSSLQPRFQEEQYHASPSLVHASPRFVGTPQSSSGPQRLVSVGSALTPTGPEKPQRTYEDNNNKPRSLSQGNPPRGVRFQDPQEETNKVIFSFLLLFWVAGLLLYLHCISLRTTFYLGQ